MLCASELLLIFSVCGLDLLDSSFGLAEGQRVKTVCCFESFFVGFKGTKRKDTIPTCLRHLTRFLAVRV